MSNVKNGKFSRALKAGLMEQSKSDKLLVDAVQVIFIGIVPLLTSI